MRNMVLRKNDEVIVVCGKDKGKSGKILKVIPEKQKVIVEKVNFTKEFIRRDQSKNIQGGIMEKEAPIHVSNVKLYCPDCGQGVRVKMQELQDGSKTRICQKCESSFEKHK
ncbi:MAG: 50S ribosomal protein L24 [Candidatus Aminicenantes bacterium]|jgi:large subunit ribosomal protein L24